MVHCYVKLCGVNKLILRLVSSAHPIIIWPCCILRRLDGSTSAGPSLSLAATQRKPFAAQLADASVHQSIF